LQYPTEQVAEIATVAGDKNIGLPLEGRGKHGCVIGCIHQKQRFAADARPLKSAFGNETCLFFPNLTSYTILEL
jgi:hypothetical protein